MSTHGYASPTQTKHFIEQYGLQPYQDARSLEPVCFRALAPALVQLTNAGTTAQHITETGADFHFSRLDYLRGSTEVRASRMIAHIMSGKRTELAYWQAHAPAKKLAVHRGIGALVIGRAADQSTAVFRLDSEVTSSIVLPPGHFYTFEASPESPEPLIVSGLYEEGESFEGLELYFEPGQTRIETTKGELAVPEEYVKRYQPRQAVES